MDSDSRAQDRLPLWREVVGEELRSRRREEGQTLVETAKRAGISPQYLSEMERGRKDASSEMVAAVAGALGMDLLELTSSVVVALEARATTSISTRGAWVLAA